MKIICFIAVLAVNMNSVNAKEVWRSQCGPDTPEATMAQDQLSPWFVEMKEKTTAQPAFQQIAKALVKQLTDSDKVVCFLIINREGKIKSVQIRRSSGSEKVDRSIVTLLRKLSPFKSPPNSLPEERGVTMEFSAKDQTILLSNQLGRLINKRTGENAN